MTDAHAGKDRLFLLGLGAQKSGTTWLSTYLAAAPNVIYNNIKEYHVWDALHATGGEARRISPEQSRRSIPDAIRFSLQQSPQNYFAYFADLLDRNPGNVTFDITPAYAGLKREVLRTIRDGFLRRAITPRAVFLMRDPVERCWSSARNTGRRQAGRSDVGDEEVIALARSARAEIRTRYDVTIGEIEAAFPAPDYQLALYEEMFELDRLAEISRFCGVPLMPGMRETRVMSCAKTRALSEDAIRTIAQLYRPVYEYIARRMPRATELWPGYRYL